MPADPHDRVDAPLLLIVTEGGLSVVAADWGMDDVLLATAGPAEVEARLRLSIGRLAAKRDPEDPEAHVIRSGEVTVDDATYTAKLGGRPLDLTFKEFELLKFLAQHPGRVFTRQQLLQEVWGYDYFGGTRTVDVHAGSARSSARRTRCSSARSATSATGSCCRRATGAPPGGPARRTWRTSRSRRWTSPTPYRRGAHATDASTAGGLAAAGRGGSASGDRGESRGRGLHRGAALRGGTGATAGCSVRGAGLVSTGVAIARTGLRAALPERPTSSASLLQPGQPQQHAQAQERDQRGEGEDHAGFMTRSPCCRECDWV